MSDGKAQQASMNKLVDSAKRMADTLAAEAAPKQGHAHEEEVQQAMSQAIRRTMLDLNSDDDNGDIIKQEVQRSFGKLKFGDSKPLTTTPEPKLTLKQPTKIKNLTEETKDPFPSKYSTKAKGSIF